MADAPAPAVPAETPEAAAAGAVEVNDNQAAAAKLGVSIPGSTYTPGVLTTSSASRSNYADNTNTMNAATANMGTPGGMKNYIYMDKSGKPQQVSASSPEEAMKLAPNIDPRSGVTDNPPPTPTPAAGSDKSGAGKPAADGSVDNGDETTTLADGTKIASSLKGVWDTSVNHLDDQIAQAKANLLAAAANMQNDPAASAAIQQITAKWESQIAAQKQKNAFILGSAAANAARTGGLQYANEMDTNFMGDEQQRALDRVTSLVTQETNAVLQAQASYKKGDVAAFSAASNSLEKIQNDKTSALIKLLNESDKILKQKTTAVKDAQAQQKTTLAMDVTTASKIAAGMVASLNEEGVTDPKEIQKYVEAMATKNGITNPDILAGALATAQQTAAKSDASVRNTNSTIANRGNKGKAPAPKGGTDGGYSYSADDVKSYTSLMNNGGKDPAGNTFNGRGEDGFVDPGTYTASYKDWIKQGGTPQGFVKKFPVTNVNPDSYSKLPKAIQPKAKATSGPPV